MYVYHLLMLMPCLPFCLKKKSLKSFVYNKIIKNKKIIKKTNISQENKKINISNFLPS